MPTLKLISRSATSAAIIVILLAATASADLCVLEHGSYDISGTPCATADGDSDDIIDLVFQVGENIELDVVYEQTAGPYQVELYTYLMFYDTANMDGTSIICNPDPSNYFTENMASVLHIPECTTPYGGSAGNAVDTEGIKVVEQTFMNFTGNNFPEPPVSFILDELTIPNGYTTPSSDLNPGSEVYTFDFSTTGGSPTDVGLIFTGGNRCGVLTGAQQCSTEGITIQEIMQSRLFIESPSCYTGQPGSASITCSGREGCTPTSGTADVKLTYSVPNTCWANDICGSTSSDCSNYGVEFQNLAMETVQGTSGTYSETANVGDSVSYIIYGISDNCAGSSGLDCLDEEPSITVGPVQCICGNPPEISLSETSVGDLDSYPEGHDLILKFSLTDPDGSLPDHISQIIFYYATSTEALAGNYTLLTSSLESDGTFYADVDGDYINEGETLYYGVAATDMAGLTSVYPSGFATSPSVANPWYVSGSKFKKFMELPDIEIAAPVDGQMVGPTVSIAGANTELEFDSYTVEYGEGTSPSSWTAIVSEDISVVPFGNLATWDNSALSNGVYTIKLTVYSDGGVTNSTSVSVTVDNIAPTAEITAPAEDSDIFGSVTVTGSASDADNFTGYVLEYGIGATPSSWIPISDSDSPVTSGTLGTWNTVMEDPESSIMYSARTISIIHDYSLRLTVSDDAGNVSQDQVFVRVDNSGDPDRMTPDEIGTAPSWSLDGNKIAFTSYSAGSSIGSIFLLNVNGPDVLNEISVTNNPQMYEPAWSPDGSMLAGVSSGFEPGVLIFSPDGGQRVNILQETYSQDEDRISPTWSPDGNEIAFSRTVMESTRIWVADKTGTNLRQLTDGPMNDIQPAWSPDGTMVAFARTTSDTDTLDSDIWVIDLSTMEETQLTFAEGADYSPAWTPDGNIVFTSDRSGNSDIFEMYASGTAQTQVTFHPYEDYAPAVSADGTKLAFGSNRSGKSEIWIMPLSVTMDEESPAPPESAPKVAQYEDELRTNVDCSESIPQESAGFYVYRKVGSSSFAKYGGYRDPSDNVFDETSLTDNETYCYMTTVVNEANNESEPSAQTCLTVSLDSTPPAAPGNVSALAGDAQVTISWSAPTQDSDGESLVDLEGFHVYRSGNGTDFEAITSQMLDPDTSSHLDSSVVNNVTWYYYVTALDDDGNESDPSATVTAVPTDTPDTVAPAAPSDLSVTPADQGASISWSAPTLNEDSSALTDLSGFFIYISTDSVTFTAHNSIAVTSESYELTGIVNGDIYYIQVTAIDGYGNESDPSETESFMPVAPLYPSAPDSFTAVGGDGIVIVSWQNPADSNFDGVYLRRDTSTYPESENDGTGVYTGTDETYTDSGLTNGTTYYYSIFSHNTNGNYSSLSDDTKASAVPQPWALNLIGGWNMVTLPYTGMDPLPTELEEIEGSGAFLWNGSTYIHASDESFAGFSPGAALWFHSEAAHSSIAVSGTAVSQDPFSISLSAGWNMVGNPFDTLVSWSDDSVSVKIGSAAAVPLSEGTDCLTGEIYRFLEDGSYERIIGNNGGALLPFKGYFIRGRQDCELQIAKP